MDSYIFPFVGNSKIAEMKEKSRIGWQRRINKRLRLIGRRLKFDFNLNLSLARHSFATHLKLEKVPVPFMSDAMGIQVLQQQSFI